MTIEHRTDTSLVTVLRHARNHAEYYRRLSLDEEDLETFPVIDRDLLRRNLVDLITDAAVKSRLLDILEGRAVPDAVATKTEFQVLNGIVIEQTSGSSGVPLRMPKTKAERTGLGLAAWKCRMRFDPSIRAETFLPVFHRQLDTQLEVSPFESSATAIGRFYAWVASKGIRWLHAPVSLMAYHAGVLRARRMQTPAPSLRFVELAGSHPDEAARQLIASTFGVRTINHYGTRESWTIGLAEGQFPFTLNDEAVHVELLDGGGRPITECGREGSVAITSKILRLLPLIRYRTGDRGAWRSEPADSGGLARRLVLAAERDINMLFHGGRWQSGNTLFKEVLHNIDRTVGFGYTRFMQIRKTGAFRWKLVVTEGEASQAISGELKAYLSRWDSRNQLETELLAEHQGRALVERKPYLFVNEFERPPAGAAPGDHGPT
ncbi:MAG TPA: hypothetical protein VGL42_05320 [Opitutaceae bacterium]|jgi:phenylacetate-CoA ligase